MEDKTILTLNIGYGRKPITYYINENDCYVCTSHKGNDKGYIKVSGKRIHHLLYNLHVGEIPQGMIILHQCDNPSCLNVEHYKIGTIKENNQEAHDRKRRDQKSNTRLTIDQKRELYENKDNLSNAEIRAKYGVGESTIKDIRKAFRERKLQ